MLILLKVQRYDLNGYLPSPNSMVDLTELVICDSVIKNCHKYKNIFIIGYYLRRCYTNEFFSFYAIWYVIIIIITFMLKITTSLPLQHCTPFGNVYNYFDYFDLLYLSKIIYSFTNNAYSICNHTSLRRMFFFF